LGRDRNNNRFHARHMIVGPGIGLVCFGETQGPGTFFSANLNT
jgi:hypothetical protein